MERLEGHQQRCHQEELCSVSWCISSETESSCQRGRQVVSPHCHHIQMSECLFSVSPSSLTLTQVMKCRVLTGNLFALAAAVYYCMNSCRTTNEENPAGVLRCCACSGSCWLQLCSELPHSIIYSVWQFRNIFHWGIHCSLQQIKSVVWGIGLCMDDIANMYY